MNIHEKIKNLADQKDISIYRIEKDCHLGMGCIMKWAKSSPTIEKLQKVADYLDVNIDYLLGKTDSLTAPVADNLIEDVRPDIIVPDVLYQVGIGFYKGEKSLTKDDINDIALIIEMKLNKRNAENEDK